MKCCKYPSRKITLEGVVVKVAWGHYTLMIWRFIIIVFGSTVVFIVTRKGCQNDANSTQGMMSGCLATFRVQDSFAFLPDVDMTSAIRSMKTSKGDEDDVDKLLKVFILLSVVLV